MGLASSIDYFGENVSDPAEAERVTEQYVALAQTLERAPADTFLSIDLSHIGLDQPGDHVQRRLERIASALPAGRRIQVGAEQERRADRIQATVSAVAGRGGAVSATVQANLRRSRADARALAESAVPIRLVKGAYAEDPEVAWPRGEATDLAFLELAHELHADGAEVAIATHDAVLREALRRALPEHRRRNAARGAQRGRERARRRRGGRQDLRSLWGRLVPLRDASLGRVCGAVAPSRRAARRGYFRARWKRRGSSRRSPKRPCSSS